MFGLFKRTKINDWEINLLIASLENVIIKDIESLKDQAKSNLFRGVLVNVSDIKGYVAFTYNTGVISDFEDTTKKDYKLDSIKVFDLKSNSYLNYTIYISCGVISGYAIDTNDKFIPDLDRIDCSGLKKVYIQSIDLKNVSKILSKEEIKLINRGYVYKVEIDNKEYYNVKDLEDGDFIGIDLFRNLYEITHDPFEIIKLDKTLEQVLGNVSK